jgi:SAM-dependent methyltransferase
MTTPTWLPDKRYYEYVYHKSFNPDVRWETWKSWDEWDYPKSDITWLSHVIGAQLPHLQNRRVLDVGCGRGYIGLFCLHNGASHVTGIDVRNDLLDLAREVNVLAGYANHELKNVNINQHQQILDLCNKHDTVMLAGILPVITDHYGLLRMVAESTAQTVIVDSCPSNIFGNTYPLVEWRELSTTNDQGPYQHTRSELFVGTPNQKWVERALIDLKFKIVYNQIFDLIQEDGTLTSKCVLVGTKS